MVFRSGKCWTSFDVCEWESTDDDDDDMKAMTHDHSILLEECNHCDS